METFKHGADDTIEVHCTTRKPTWLFPSPPRGGAHTHTHTHQGSHPPTRTPSSPHYLLPPGEAYIPPELSTASPFLTAPLTGPHRLHLRCGPLRESLFLRNICSGCGTLHGRNRVRGGRKPPSVSGPQRPVTGERTGGAGWDTAALQDLLLPPHTGENTTGRPSIQRDKRHRRLGRPCERAYETGARTGGPGARSVCWDRVRAGGLPCAQESFNPRGTQNFALAK